MCENAFDGLCHTPLLLTAPADIPTPDKEDPPPPGNSSQVFGPCDRVRAAALVPTDRKGTSEPAHDRFRKRRGVRLALATATVGLAFGHQSEITTEAAGAVIMGTSLKRVDELFHLARRMRRIVLQGAVGGMALSLVGMLIAFAGWLPPVGGAIFQEVIDRAAVLNALRAAVPGGELSDF